MLIHQAPSTLPTRLFLASLSNRNLLVPSTSTMQTPAMQAVGTRMETLGETLVRPQVAGESPVAAGEVGMRMVDQGTQIKASSSRHLEP